MSIQRRVGVGLTKQALDGEQDGLHVVDSAPVLFEDVQADVAGLVDIGVEARSIESNLGSYLNRG